MRTKEEILESITGKLSSDKLTHAINIPIGWIFQAMQQYAEEYHKDKILNLKKSDHEHSLPYTLNDMRLKLKLSLRDVAKKTGVSASTISRIERGSDCDFRSVKALYEFYSINETGYGLSKDDKFNLINEWSGGKLAS